MLKSENSSEVRKQKVERCAAYGRSTDRSQGLWAPIDTAGKMTRTAFALASGFWCPPQVVNCLLIFIKESRKVLQHRLKVLQSIGSSSRRRVVFHILKNNIQKGILGRLGFSIGRSRRLCGFRLWLKAGILPCLMNGNGGVRDGVEETARFGRALGHGLLLVWKLLILQYHIGTRSSKKLSRRENVWSGEARPHQSSVEGQRPHALEGAAATGLSQTGVRLGVWAGQNNRRLLLLARFFNLLAKLWHAPYKEIMIQC